MLATFDIVKTFENCRSSTFQAQVSACFSEAELKTRRLFNSDGAVLSTQTAAASLFIRACGDSKHLAEVLQDEHESESIASRHLGMW